MKYQEGNWKYKTLARESYQTTIHIPYPIQNEYISMTMDGLITIRKGYCWDGPSGPTFDTKTFMRGSLFHDAAYQLMRESLVDLVHLPEFDAMLVNITEEDGMNRIRRWWVYRGVRLGGGPSANPRKIVVKEAP